MDVLRPPVIDDGSLLKEVMEAREYLRSGDTHMAMAMLDWAIGTRVTPETKQEPQPAAMPLRQQGLAS